MKKMNPFLKKNFLAQKGKWRFLLSFKLGLSKKLVSLLCKCYYSLYWPLVRLYFVSKCTSLVLLAASCPTKKSPSFTSINKRASLFRAKNCEGFWLNIVASVFFPEWLFSISGVENLQQKIVATVFCYLVSIHFCCLLSLSIYSAQLFLGSGSL